MEGCFLSESEGVSRSIVSDSYDCKDCRSPGSSVHGVLQDRILEWVAVPFSRGSSQLRDQTQVSCIPGDSLPAKPPRKLYLRKKKINRDYPHNDPDVKISSQGL